MIESPESLENMPAHKGGRDYYFEGLALGREGRHEEAILAFSGALSVDPDNSRAWVGMGFNLGKLGRYEEEIECCEKAISLDPKSVDAWNYKGFAYGMLGRFLDKGNDVKRHWRSIRRMQQPGIIRVLHWECCGSMNQRFSLVGGP